MVQKPVRQAIITTFTIKVKRIALKYTVKKVKGL